MLVLVLVLTATRCNGNNIDQFPPGNFFVAVNEGLWDNGAACGRRYRLRCLSGRNRPCKTDIIEVQVVNFCPKSPCPSSFLMSKEAFSAISRLSSVKLNVEYIEYVTFSLTKYIIIHCSKRFLNRSVFLQDIISESLQPCNVKH